MKKHTAYITPLIPMIPAVVIQTAVSYPGDTVPLLSLNKM